MEGTLEKLAQLCVSAFAEYCIIEVVIEALGKADFAARAGTHADQPVGARGRILEQIGAGRRSFGSICCETSDPSGFDDVTRRAISVVAIQLATVLAAYAASQREHRVADRFQRALLPQELPTVPGVTFHAAYRPASDEADVGGDWYDSFPLPDGRVAISVGDVAGHGLDAAMIMGEVRQAIRTAAIGGSSPSGVLDYVNGALRLRDSIGMVTAIYGIYDPASSVLAYAVAGHPPPILVLENGTTRRLPSVGLPLGCAPEIESHTWTFTLPQGARAVFYTDGLIENERDLIAGEERLIEVVRSLQEDPAADPAEAVQERVFDKLSNRDDAAVLVLGRTSPVPYFLFSAVPVVSPVARAIVEQAMGGLDLDEDRQFGVLVAVGEAIANAVEHAYRGLDPGLIRLQIESGGGQLQLTIEDFGRWRPFVRREERGRGIELMHAFTDGVQIRSTRESTAVTLKIHFGAVTANQAC